MASTDFLGDPIFQGIDGNGVPVAGGLVWCYVAGTSTLKPMYGTITDAVNGTNPIANPCVLDSSGRASIVYAGASKFVFENNDINPGTGHGSVIWTADNVGATGTGGAVLDPNGRTILTYGYVANAINYVTITNAATGQSPVISSAGADAQVGLKLKTKGTTQRVVIESNLGSYGLPLQDGSAGSVYVSNGAGGSTFTGAGWDTFLGTPNATNFRAKLPGTTTGTGNLVFAATPQIDTPNITGRVGAAVPGAGFVGQNITSGFGPVSPLVLTSTTPANIRSISLTAGYWLIFANVNFFGVTIDRMDISISTTSTTLENEFLGNKVYSPGITAGSRQAVVAPLRLMTVTSTTTIYLVGVATFSGGSCSADGNITAVRMG